MAKETPLDDPRQKADQELKPGLQMDELLRKIRQLETALHINEWLSSPELQPPEPAAQKKLRPPGLAASSFRNLILVGPHLTSVASAGLPANF